MKTEDYVCQRCGQTATREVKRGTRPKWCMDCRAVAYHSDQAKQCVDCGRGGLSRDKRVIRCADCTPFRKGRAYCKVPSDHPSRVVLRSPRVPAPLVSRECPRCGDSFVTNQPHQIHCGRPCSAKASRLRRRVAVAKVTGEWTWGEFMRIAARFDYRCAYCGVKPDRLDPDHVVPLSRGGANCANNLLPACRWCNGDKRDLSLTEWAADRHRRGLPVLTTSWPDSDRRVSHLTYDRTHRAA